ncbi:postacrosomal sheath WW domain-binding protein [Brachypodium distachyon]|uniref:Uncharacterized protein n=1 Tax=Brachypodium distachyon TaxID=15368 RepID=A0A0Q3J088_BRADI|nr:postacrosomal sheath WW domain-binding protein [Brachypodium distachyon]KQK06068.1 hypothetical protein BRADI_2g24240v3 [Brachypodium distachyon]|eukprot:XP_003566211.1 postacrosomal sheath WW domain-binding protein [Brachypodium distachyon]
MAGKMDQTMIIVCAVVGSLGVLSAILGFSAEGTKLTLSDILLLDGTCLYPQNPALALGICASIFLVMAQITVAAVGGCCGCCKSRAMPSETRRIAGVVCAVISWIAAVAAFAMLVEGAAWNANVARDTYPVCYVLKDGIFAGAAVLTLVATALGLTSYVLLRGKPADAAAAAAAAAAGPKTGEQPGAGAGVAMGQPQFPPPPVPQGYGHGQAPPNYPQYNTSPQGYGQFPPAYGAHAPNQQYAPQGYGANAPNQQFPPQGYGAHAPNQQFPPPAAHGYGSMSPNQQFPPPPAPAQGYEPHAQVPPPPKGHEQV